MIDVNNYERLSLSLGNVFADFSFYLIILLQTMLFTSLGRVYPVPVQYLGKLELLLILGLLFYSLLLTITLRKILFASLIFLLILVSTKYYGSTTPYTKLLILIVAVPSAIPSPKKILKIFGFAMLTTFVLTIGMSLIGVLPMSGVTSKVLFSSYQETEYFFGFTHPNIFGTFLTSLYLIFYFLNFNDNKFKVTLIGIIIFFIDIVINAGTAASGILLVLLLSLFLRRFNIMYKIAYVFPILLTVFSFWLAYNNSSALGRLINTKIASRPDIWNVYLLQFPINIFNREPNIQLDAYNPILGNGALDGGYIYILIYWGILAFIVYYLIFCSILKISFETHNIELYCIGLVIIIMAFPESHMVMFFENVFLIFIGFFQYSSTDRIRIFMNDKN